MIDLLRRHIPRPVLAIATITVVCGLALDLFYVRPQTKALKRLELKRSELIGEVTAVLASERKNRGLIEFLEEHALRLSTDRIDDPTSFLGALIEESQLVRLELKAVDKVESANLVQSRFYLRVRGDFGSTLDLVRKLEQGARLTVIEEIKVGLTSDRGQLETRINLSIFDPLRSV